MSTFTREAFDHVVMTWEAGEDRPEISAPFSPSFYLIPDMISADLPENSGWEDARNIRITGRRYRRLKAGPKDAGMSHWDAARRSRAWAHLDPLLRQMDYGRYGIRTDGTPLPQDGAP